MEQGSFLGGEGSEPEQTGDEGQSPQEQPSEVSLHEYTDAFISFIGEESRMVVLKSIEYGEPGKPGGTFWPRNSAHSGNDNQKQNALTDEEQV